MELLMMRSILATFSYRLLNNLIRLSIYFFCFYFIFPNYSDANDLLPQKSSNSNLASNNNSFSFIVWGHPRGRDDRDPPLHLNELSDLVRELKPDFIVITGDMIQGRIGHIEKQKALIESDWDFFDQCVSVLGIPIYRLPGNHDVSNKTTSTIYSRRYTQPPYSFSYNDSRFILLDSIGIKQLENDSRAYWGHEAKPFDKEQADFIKNEISNQDKYNHLFFFMHHTSPWSESESFWWDNIHPLLVNGKTRAVFSGDNPSDMKFAHDKQDGINYFLNNSFPTRTLHSYKRWPNWGPCGSKQVDNIQFVQVNGDKIKYKTHVIGELNTESLSWRYYERIEKGLSTWQRRLVTKLKAIMFNSLRRIFLVFTIWGGVCFLFGGLLILFLKRFKNN
jgi:Calcineurin-like phosphoesterase